MDNKEMEIKENVLFFSPVYETNIEDINNQKIIEEIEIIKNKFPNTSNILEYADWQSPKNLSLEDIGDKEINKLINKMFLAVNNICKIWEFDNISLSNFWININKENDFDIPHCHPRSLFSGVYYVYAKPDCGNIVFKRTDDQEYFMKSCNNIYRFDRYSFVPKNNMALFFPSYMQHYIEPNKSNDRRISIAFNFA